MKEMKEMAPLIWILVTRRENKCINDDGRQFSYYQRSSTNMERGTLEQTVEMDWLYKKAVHL